MKNETPEQKIMRLSAARDEAARQFKTVPSRYTTNALQKANSALDKELFKQLAQVKADNINKAAQMQLCLQ